MPYRRRLGALVAAAVVVAAAMTLAPGSAQAAGLYTVHQCHTPSGRPGPLDDQYFKFEVRTPGAATNTCGAPNGAFNLSLTGGPVWAGGNGAEARFIAPPATSVSAVEYSRATSGLGGNSELTYIAWAGNGDYQRPSDPKALDTCQPGPGQCSDLTGDKSLSDANRQYVLFRMGCYNAGAGACGGPSLTVAVPRVKVTLSDTNRPSISSERGSLFSNAPVDGTRDAEFTGNDKGGGVYRVIARIDGKIPAAGVVRQGAVRTLNAAKSSCVDADPSNGDLYEFWSAQPCAADQAVTITDTIDTTKLSDGAHSVQFELQDAAGNSAFVPAQPHPFRVQNIKPNGVGADRKAKITMYFAKNRKDRLTTRNGIRIVTRGRLRDRRNRGIRGAEIDVYHFVRGKPRLLKTGLKSRRRGRLTLILPIDIYGDPKTGIRTLRYSYTAFRRPKGQKQPKPTTRKTLKLRVLNKYGRPVIPKKYRRDAKR